MKLYFLKKKELHKNGKNQCNCLKNIIKFVPRMSVLMKDFIFFLQKTMHTLR